MEDIKVAVNESKMKRTSDTLNGMNTIIAAISGENVSEKKCRKRLARKLDFPVRRISGRKRIRTKVLTSDNSSWSFTKRKTRSDTLSDEVKRKVCEYWQKPGVSWLTGNKRNIKRERFGPSIYASHMIHILEKTQTDIYTDFRRENPDIKISHRSFENCKPFFVRPVRQKDRQTCCCRYHIEIKAAFKACMGFRKQVLLQKELDENDNDDSPLCPHLQDLIDITLCKTGDRFHNISCLKRL